MPDKNLPPWFVRVAKKLRCWSLGHLWVMAQVIETLDGDECFMNLKFIWCARCCAVKRTGQTNEVFVMVPEDSGTPVPAMARQSNE